MPGQIVAVGKAGAGDRREPGSRLDLSELLERVPQRRLHRRSCPADGFQELELVAPVSERSSNERLRAAGGLLREEPAVHDDHALCWITFRW